MTGQHYDILSLYTDDDTYHIAVCRISDWSTGIKKQKKKKKFESNMTKRKAYKNTLKS